MTELGEAGRRNTPELLVRARPSHGRRPCDGSKRYSGCRSRRLGRLSDPRPSGWLLWIQGLEASTDCRPFGPWGPAEEPSFGDTRST